MKFFGLILAIMAVVFAVVSGMSVGPAPAALHEGAQKAGCNGGGPGGPPPPPPTNSTS